MVATQILWTGGWDSTFQLLQLVRCRRHVTPHYIIDEDRESTGVELLTMRDIKAALFSRFEHARALLGPTEFHSRFDIPPDPVISDAFQRIRGRQFIGEQYDWLARLCAWREINELQLCIHKDDKAEAVVRRLVEECEEDCGTTCRIAPQHSGTDEFQLFRRYTFPVLYLTKRAMESIAAEQGLSSIMAMTWFCHRPRRRKPCGSCNPCIYTVEEGLGWRIPRGRRMLHRVTSALKIPTRILRRLLTSARRSNL